MGCLGETGRGVREGTRYSRIRSGGAEGELPIVGGDVFVHGPSKWKLQRKISPDTYGGKIRVQRLSLKESDGIL